MLGNEGVERESMRAAACPTSVKEPKQTTVTEEHETCREDPATASDGAARRRAEPSPPSSHAQHVKRYPQPPPESSVKRTYSSSASQDSDSNSVYLPHANESRGKAASFGLSAITERKPRSRNLLRRYQHQARSKALSECLRTIIRQSPVRTIGRDPQMLWVTCNSGLHPLCPLPSSRRIPCGQSGSSFLRLSPLRTSRLVREYFESPMAISHRDHWIIVGRRINLPVCRRTQHTKQLRIRQAK